MKYSKGATPDLRTMSRECGVGGVSPQIRQGIRYGRLLHTHHAFLCIRIALKYEIQEDTLKKSIYYFVCSLLKSLPCTEYNGSKHTPGAHCR